MEFTILSLTDISDEKRRQILEKTFFHDMNNLLSIIIGRTNLLDDATISADLAESVASIRLASQQLLEEIFSHRKLLSAEKGNLAVEPSRFSSLALIDEVLKLFSSNATWRGRTLLVEESAADFEMVSDRALLRRVLCNMVKNALEATSPGEEVRIDCCGDDRQGTFQVHNPQFMTRPVQLQIFKRSFSTKGKGRGIGTYSMKLFGENYLKGKVWFSTSEETGTTFSVSIPRMPPDMDKGEIPCTVPHIDRL
jgi:signal transduction histidine kinase